MSLFLGAPQNWEELEQSFASLQVWTRRLEQKNARLRTYTTANQSIANNTDAQIITWVTTAAIASGLPDLYYDTNELLDTSGTRIRLAAPGLYVFTASVAWEANATGWRYVGVFEGNTTGELSLVQAPAVSATHSLIQQVNLMIAMDTPDTEKIYRIGVYQNSGGALNVLTDYRNTWLQVTKVA